MNFNKAPFVIDTVCISRYCNVLCIIIIFHIIIVKICFLLQSYITYSSNKNIIETYIFYDTYLQLEIIRFLYELYL